MKYSKLFAPLAGLLCTVFLLMPLPSATDAPPSEDAAPSTEATQAEELPAFDTETELTLLTAEGTRTLTLDRYLVGVLLAEMPSDFPAEALAAQAIAARTFALKKAAAHKHPDADVCAESACCQGWTDPSDGDYPTLYAAVRQTDGLVVTYEDELIDATFFSCDGGRTESALAVWGSDIAYLRSVDSPQSADALRYDEEKIFTEDELLAALRAEYPTLSPQDRPWFTDISRTEGGGVDSVTVDGVAIGGTTLRRLLGLRSTDFEITQSDGRVTFSTRGFGHRVGLSQYGAKAMAESGSIFSEILTHYYPTTEIRSLHRP